MPKSLLPCHWRPSAADGRSFASCWLFRSLFPLLWWEAGELLAEQGMGCTAGAS